MLEEIVSWLPSHGSLYFFLVLDISKNISVFGFHVLGRLIHVLVTTTITMKIPNIFLGNEIRILVSAWS